MRQGEAELLDRRDWDTHTHTYTYSRKGGKDWDGWTDSGTEVRLVGWINGRTIDGWTNEQVD